MKVRELIEALKTMPQDLNVVFEHPEFGEYGIIDHVFTINTDGNCSGNYCDKCIQCEDYKRGKDNAVELSW